MRDLHWVVLDCPARHWDDPLVRDLFNKLIQLKLMGYRALYPETVLPIDTTDYIGNHQLICESDPYGGLHPVLASKTITHARCLEHGLAFSGLSLAGNAEGPEHGRAVEEIVADCGRRRAGLTYDSSWTVHPRAHEDRDYARLLKEMYTAIFFRVHERLEIHDCVMGGVLRFKTHQFFGSWGARPLALDGRELGAIHVKTLVGEEVQMLYLPAFSREATETAERFRSHWERARWLAPPVVASAQPPAALPTRVAPVVPIRAVAPVARVEKVEIANSAIAATPAPEPAAIAGKGDAPAAAIPLLRPLPKYATGTPAALNRKKAA